MPHVLPRPGWGPQEGGHRGTAGSLCGSSWKAPPCPTPPQSWSVTEPLTSSPAGPTRCPTPPSTSPAPGSCPGTRKVRARHGAGPGAWGRVRSSVRGARVPCTRLRPPPLGRRAEPGRGWGPAAAPCPPSLHSEAQVRLQDLRAGRGVGDGPQGAVPAGCHPVPDRRRGPGGAGGQGWQGAPSSPPTPCSTSLHPTLTRAFSPRKSLPRPTAASR